MDTSTDLTGKLQDLKVVSKGVELTASDIAKFTPQQLMRKCRILYRDTEEQVPFKLDGNCLSATDALFVVNLEKASAEDLIVHIHEFLYGGKMY